MEDHILLHRFQVVPRCKECGSDDLLMPDGVLSQDDLSDDSLITCGSCGVAATYHTILEACEASKADDLMRGAGSIGD